MALNFGPMSSETEDALLARIAMNGGLPVVKGHQLAVEQVLAMLAAGEGPAAIVRRHRGLDIDDVRACLVYARRVVLYSVYTDIGPAIS
jgi:uncharacterized protein (DUF433 family)